MSTPNRSSTWDELGPVDGWPDDVIHALAARAARIVERDLAEACKQAASASTSCASYRLGERPDE